MAAAARRPERNPVENRAAWLAKNYPRTVVADALAAWAEAVGADSYVQRFLAAAHSVPVEGALQLLENVLTQRPELRTTIYENYLPWVAKTLNDRHKLFLRFYRDLAAEHPSNQRVRRIADCRDLGEAWGQLHDPAVVTEYTRLRARMIRRFGAIVRWAAADGADLGRFSFEDAWSAAEAWIEAESTRAPSDELGIMVYAWPDGWTVREMKTKPELVREGKTMGHCTGSYDVSGGRIRETPVSSVILLYSLRDRKNRPHATMAWLPIHRHVDQLRGRGNVLPMPRHTARMAEFRDQMFPTDAVTPIPVPDWDVVRKDAKFFDGRYLMPNDAGLSLRGQPIEVWNGSVYVGIDDVDEAIADRREELRGRGLADDAVAKKLRVFLPADTVLGVDIPPWFEWWFARRGPGMALIDNDDELVQSIKLAVDLAESKPAFAAIRKPTGQRVGTS